ncbi:hypothetical protein ECE50_025575 [Chitinophaga sp. Mgbs1]|uniref:DUF4890 domain-containing protein n=1 Tax=Chitinophaga solisilvae TaxID=1233460 RepID=A0A9Q5GNW4_9BACT|nr:hypothetical protein [Chitinophaga solisilvae]
MKLIMLSVTLVLCTLAARAQEKEGRVLFPNLQQEYQQLKNNEQQKPASEAAAQFRGKSLMEYFFPDYKAHSTAVAGKMQRAAAAGGRQQAPSDFSQAEAAAKQPPVPGPEKHTIEQATLPEKQASVKQKP